jgi:hypothetical protein
MDYYRSSPQDIRRPVLPAVPIRDGNPAPVAPVRGTELRGTHRRFGNAGRNQRLGFPLEARKSVVWKSQLPDHVTPEYVIAGSSCVILKAVEGWLVFDGSGRLLHSGYAGAGELTLDARPRLFYAVTDTGYVAAFSLEDGLRRFYLTPFFGHQFSRDFIQRTGTQMIIASTERPRSSHARVPANLSVIEIQDLGRKVEIDSTGWLESAERIEYLKRKTVQLRVAMHGDELALATDDSLSLTNHALQLKREFTGSFHPLWLSVDEQMRSYLIVRAENRLALWLVTHEGERVVNIPLPEEVYPIAPPVVSHDHKTFVIASHRVIAVDAQGAICWENAEASKIAGAAVTSDDRLLIASGPELIAYEPGGDRVRLLEVEDDTFTTAPAAGDTGELFVAGSRFLYRVY